MKTIIAFLAVIFLAVCPRVGRGAEDVVGDEVEAVVLLDVNPLWGGKNLWLRGDGTGVLQVAGRPPNYKLPGHQETRWELKLSAAEMAELNKILREQSFATIRTRDRSHGLCDDAAKFARNRTGCDFGGGLQGGTQYCDLEYRGGSRRRPQR